MVMLVRDLTTASISKNIALSRTVPEVAAAACIMSAFSSGSSGASVASVLAAAGAGKDVLGDVMRGLGGGGSAGGDDDDVIHTTSTLLSVKDSVSWMVMTLPARGSACLHAQCFELMSFLQLHSRTSFKRWECPICSKVCALESAPFCPLPVRAPV